MIRLKELREQKGLSQYKLADILGISQQRLSFYELGVNEPKNDMLTKIADYFGVTTDYLLGKTENNDYKKIYLEEELRKLRSLLGNRQFTEKEIQDISKQLLEMNIELIDKKSE